MQRLNQLRKQIDRIDKQIFNLLVKRINTVKRISSFKRKHKLKTQDKHREKQIFDKLKNYSKKAKIPITFSNKVFRSIISYSKIIQKQSRRTKK